MNKKTTINPGQENEIARTVSGGNANGNGHASATFSESSGPSYGGLGKDEQVASSPSRPSDTVSVYLGWDFDDDSKILIGSRYRGTRPARRRRLTPAAA